jgi:hypothetical protein
VLGGGAAGAKGDLAASDPELLAAFDAMVPPYRAAGVVSDAEMLKFAAEKDPDKLTDMVQQFDARLNGPGEKPQAATRQVQNEDGSVDLFATQTNAAGETYERFVRRIPPPVVEVGPAGIRRAAPGAPAGDGLPAGGPSRRINDLFGD